MFWGAVIVLWMCWFLRVFVWVRYSHAWTYMDDVLGLAPEEKYYCILTFSIRNLSVAILAQVNVAPQVH
jgi:hypothetical protein